MPPKASSPSSVSARRCGRTARLFHFFSEKPPPMSVPQDRVIITAALTGILANREQCPYLPYTPVEIAEEARRAFEAGAAVVHIHGREPLSGSPTWEPATYLSI